jgi:hypothetical protein
MPAPGHQEEGSGVFPKYVTRTPAHRAITRALEAAWRRDLLPEPPLDPETLAADAQRSTGLDDFGTGWHPAFATLLRSLRDEAELNAIGRTFASGQISQLLRARLRAHALWRRHPEILDRPLAPPVIILGQARSGTTRLQRLLACDPAFLNLRFFESFEPVPRPGRADWRPIQAHLVLRLLRSLNPALAQIHPAAATAPDEPYGLFGFSLHGAQFEAQWRVPSFARSSLHRDRALVYAEFKQLLQTISWWRADDEARPWLLKAPQFMEDLAPLLAAFPDARLIRLHRDPATVVASSASLVWNQMNVQSDEADKEWIGREWLEKTVRREAACRRDVAAHPDVPRFDLDYKAIERDWRGEMRRVYSFLGRPLRPAIEARMQSYLDRAERQGFRRHSYRLEDFALDEAEIHSRLDAVGISRPPSPQSSSGRSPGPGAAETTPDDCFR